MNPLLLIGGVAAIYFLTKDKKLKSKLPPREPSEDEPSGPPVSVDISIREMTAIDGTATWILHSEDSRVASGSNRAFVSSETLPVDVNFYVPLAGWGQPKVIDASASTDHEEVDDGVDFRMSKYSDRSGQGNTYRDRDASITISVVNKITNTTHKWLFFATP